MARRVHAQLRFMPDDPYDDLWPTPTQGEWEGCTEPEIDLPGSGAAHMLNVALVSERYPYVYEWTPRSRAGGVKGYTIAAEPAMIEVIVSGENVEPLSDTLRIDVRPGSLGTIAADWMSMLGEVSTNMRPWARHG